MPEAIPGLLSRHFPTFLRFGRWMRYSIPDSMRRRKERETESLIPKLLCRKGQRDRIVPAILSALFLLAFFGTAWTHPLLPFVVALFGLPLMHLILCIPVLTFRRRLRRTGRGADLLVTPLERSSFAQAFHVYFWKVTLWCGVTAFVALFGLTDAFGIGTSGTGVGTALANLFGFAFWAGLALTTGAWVIYWSLVRSLIGGPFLVVLIWYLLGLLAHISSAPIPLILFTWGIGFALYLDCRFLYAERLRRRLAD